MSNITDPTENANTANAPVSPRAADKGKNKAVDTSMEEDDDEEEDEEDENMDEDEEDGDEDAETFDEIDPSAILPTGRRTRGVRVDYSSKEALEKAGLKPQDLDEDDDEDVKMD